MIRNFVASPKEKKGFQEEIELKNWNWYAVNVLYDIIPESSQFEKIGPIFYKKFNTLDPVKALIRIKVNFYPWTDKIYEHAQHTDSEFSHKAAVYSLNTCDGFTRMSNGDKVESIANRLVLFDGSQPHNSSTTSNKKGRFNINFNWF